MKIKLENEYHSPNTNYIARKVAEKIGIENTVTVFYVDCNLEIVETKGYIYEILNDYEIIHEYQSSSLKMITVSANNFKEERWFALTREEAIKVQIELISDWGLQLKKEIQRVEKLRLHSILSNPIGAIKLGLPAYHKQLSDGREDARIVGIRENEVELYYDVSGGTNHVYTAEWFPIEGLLFERLK